VGTASAISQPTRPTQPAIPPGSVKWVVTHYMGYGRWGPLYSWLGCLAGRCASLCLQGTQTFRFMALFLGFWSFGSLRNDCLRAHLWLAGGCGLAASQSANNEASDRQYYRYRVFISALPEYLVKLKLVSCRNLLLVSLDMTYVFHFNYGIWQTRRISSFKGFGTFLNCAQIVFGDARHVQWSVTSTPPTTTPRTHHEPKRQ